MQAKYFTVLFLMVGLCSCTNRPVHKKGAVNNDTIYFAKNPTDVSLACRRFIKFSTADEYFEDACNKTKDCNNDSLTNIAAMKEYACAIELNPKLWQARRNYARLLYSFGRYQDAVDQLNEAFKHTSEDENPDLNIDRALANYKLGKFKEAIKDYNSVLKYGMDSAYVLLNKAKAKLGLI